MQEFLGFQFEILSKPHNKNSYIKITKEGKLVFSYPSRFPNKLYNAKQYIMQNQDYIRKNYQDFLQKKNARQKNLQKYVTSYLHKYPNSLIIFDKAYEIDGLSIEILSNILYDKSYKLLCEMADIMKLDFDGLSISYANSYLGQCRNRHIKIDYRNVLSPENLLRYLVIHELSHIRYANHSSKFWNEVGKFYNEYQIAKKEIKILATNHAEVLRHYNLLPKSYKN